MPWKADAPSRGMTPPELRGHTLWWEGPSWLGFEREDDNYTTELPIDCTVEFYLRLMITEYHRL